MIGIIAAVSQNGVIGVYDQITGKGSIPWHYKADMKYFRETTTNSTVIFGRKTFETIGKALPKRRNVVISSTKIDVEGIETFSNIKEAMKKLEGDYQESCKIFEAPDMDCLVEKQSIWFAGGARIYEEGMEYASTIHLTLVPDIITGRSDEMAKFPFINPYRFKEVEILQPSQFKEDNLQLYICQRVY